jgi:lysophospholipid acyltransferase (LPLAT)-like uncharacterized protein
VKIRPPLALAVVAGRFVAELLGSTCRVRVQPGGPSLDAVPTPAILACWHEQILAAAPFAFGLADGGRRMAVMASLSRDGELIARIAAAHGAAVVRGSTSRGGRAGLLALYRVVSGSGASPLVLPDGPRGPRREPKAGVVVLAQMTGAPIAPFACVPRRAIALRSWDRMLLPAPFTVVSVALGELVSVPRQLSEAERERCIAALRVQLDELTHRASLPRNRSGRAGRSESAAADAC